MSGVFIQIIVLMFLPDYQIPMQPEFYRAAIGQGLLMFFGVGLMFYSFFIGKNKEIEGVKK